MLAKPLLTITLILFTILSFAQKDYIIENYTPDKEKVLSSTNLVFYGLDFSKTFITQPEKMGYNVRFRKYFWPWINRFEAIIKPESKLPRWMDKSGYVKYEYGEVQKLCEIERTWIRIDDYDYPIDTLQQVVKSYELSESDGVGMVVNILNLNKRREEVKIWVTFFDIESREILWATKTVGRAAGTGMTVHWGDGMIDAFKRYINQVYKKEI